MADDTAKLVLSLEARFDKFEKSMKDAAAVVDKQTKIIENRFTDMTKVISSKLAGIQGSFVSQAGTLGQALAALGPIGVGAAVGIGAIVLTLNDMAKAAERVGQKAIAIKDFSLTTGFTIEETQALRKAVSALGKDFDTVEKAVQLFTIQLHELQTTGKGPLADALRTIDQNLVSLMINAGSSSEALFLLFEAMKKMDTGARNALGRTAGGKGGIAAFAELAVEVEKLKRLFADGLVGAKTGKEIKDLADNSQRLTNIWKEFDSERDKAKNTEFITQGQLFIVGRMLELTKAFNQEGITAALLVLQRQAMDLAGLGATIVKPTEVTPKRVEATVIGGPVPLPVSRPSDEAIAVALQQKAVTLLTDRIAKLDNLKTLQGELEPLQATELANLEAQLRLAKTPDATVEQRNAVTRSIKQNNEAYELLIIGMKESLGVATLEEIQTAKTIAINKAKSQGLISGLEAERAATIAVKEAREKYEAQLVRASSLPGLQQRANELNNVAKQLDKIGGQALDSFSDNMADAILGTKTFADAFKAMTNVILKEMIKISIQKALIGPLLSGLGGILPIAGKMAGGPVMAGTPYIVGERGPEIMVPNTSGTILPNSALQRSGQSIIYAPNIDARGASVEAVARLAQIVEQDRASFASKTIATIQQARRGRVPGL